MRAPTRVCSAAAFLRFMSAARVPDVPLCCARGAWRVQYNAVLRAKSGDAFLSDMCRKLCKGNEYVTTIHAINSCVLKLSKLMKAAKVWRGIKDARLPPEFWVPNEMGVRGGIEYGFSSTTTDKEQAQACESASSPS